MAKKAETEKDEKVVKEADITKIKTELTKYIDESIDETITKKIDAANKFIIKEKNKKILGKNILITFLLLVIVALLYIMNSEGYFMKFTKNQNDKNISNIVTPNDTSKEETTEPEKEPEVTLDDLKKEHGYLLDSIIINTNSNYYDDYLKGELTENLKHELALNRLDFSTLETEEDYNIIDSSNLKKHYNELFDSDYTSINFKYYDNQIRYISKLDSYVTSSILTKKESNIEREITDIKVDNDDVTIKTIEGIIEDDKLYNISSHELVSEENLSLKDNSDKLTKREYTFKKQKLTKIK